NALAAAPGPGSNPSRPTLRGDLRQQSAGPLRGAWWLTRSQLRQALEAIPPAQRYVVTCGSSLLARYAV
ncbi:hypothetical protein CQA70_29870, partial [Klebsiella pneumoniae]